MSPQHDDHGQHDEHDHQHDEHDDGRTLPPDDEVTAGDDFSRDDPGTKVAEHQRLGTGVRRIGYPILLSRGRLVRRVEVTPSMLRLTVAGDDFTRFHSHQCDDHVKVVFPLADGTRNDPTIDEHRGLAWAKPVPPGRKYTVRRHDPVAGEVDLDVVVHPGGLASEWAAAVAVGDEVVLAGPPGAKAFALTYDHYVFAVDPTALPALGRWLDESPADVSADVLVDHDHAHEQGYPLAERPGVRVTWLDRSGGSRLADAVHQLALPAGRVFLFAAGEATDIKPLRRWAKERGIDALVTGYWKRGVSDLDE